MGFKTAKGNKKAGIAIAVMGAILLFLSAEFVPSSVTSADTLPSNKPKATWLWHTSLIGTSAGRSDILQFAKKQQVGRIFLQVNRDIAMGAYRSFIRTASAGGIEVYALDGAPEWALPENKQRIADLVDWVKGYNASVQKNERFTGIQVDVEPYQLPEWTSNQSAAADNWRQAMGYFNELAKKEPALPTSAAVPFWLDGIKLADGSGTLSEAIMAELDETAVMAYRDQAMDVVDLAGAELAAGDRLGKKVWIGVETNPAPDTPFITFYEEGRKEMERQLAIIDGMVHIHPSYAGISVHDYAGWLALRN